jgi:hypothetical protein
VLVAPDTLRDAATWIQKAAERRLGSTPEFVPLTPAESGQVVAVDGSHAVLADVHGVWVVAVRAAAVRWPGDVGLTEQPVVTAISADEAPALLDARFSHWGLDAPRAGSAQALAEALRELAEMEAAVNAVATDSGLGGEKRSGLLLIDGALENLGRHAQPMADRVVEAATRADVAVVGVAKQSRLREADAPMVPALAAAGPAAPWAVRVAGYTETHVCRLHAGARHAFRVDVRARGHAAEALVILGRLLPLARDAVYLGYPYPLALAHNRVAIGQADAHALRSALETAVHEVGGAAALRLLDDFHSVLDDNVP